MSNDPVDLISDQEVIELTQELVRIPSQYIEDELAQHAEIAEYLADYMRSIGLEVTIAEAVKDYPVVIGATPGGGEGSVVGVLGHYSTVAVGDLAEWDLEPFSGELIDDKIYGRGSADQKGSIASVLIAAKALLQSGLPRKGKLKILLVPGEGCTEMALEPIVAENPDLLRCDVYLDSDGGPGKITLVHGGWVWLELIVKGKGGHAGSLTRDGSVPVNPVKKLVSVLYNLQDGKWMEPKPHPLFTPEYGRYTADPLVDVDVFHAGSKVNTIPNEARAQIDVRLLPAQTIEGVLGELDVALDKLRAEDPYLDISYRILNRSKNPREISPGHWMIKQIQETCRDLDFPEPRLVGSIGGGRGALSGMGPVMHFGAAGGNGAHAPNEWAPVDGLLIGSRLQARLYTRVLAGE